MQFEQAEEMLLGINVKEKPSSASKLYDWTVTHPGPEAAAAAAMAVRLVRTQMPYPTFLTVTLWGWIRGVPVRYSRHLRGCRKSEHRCCGCRPKIS